jgi:integrase
MPKRNFARRKRGAGPARPYPYRGGRWRIQWFAEDGQRRSAIFDSYEEAEAALVNRRAEVRQIKDGRKKRPTAVPTFTEFVERFYTPNVTAKKRWPSGDRYVLKNHLTPVFGVMPLDQITTRAIEEYKANALANKALSADRQRIILSLLRSILKYATFVGELAAAPIVKTPKIEERDCQWLDLDQLRVLIRVAREIEGDDVADFYAVAAFAGLRLGELAGLRWCDIDLPRRLLTVARSWTAAPKSGRVRRVPVLDVLAPILAERRKRSGEVKPADLVFPSSTGTLLDRTNPNIARATFRRVLGAAKLPIVRFHGLRHSFASAFVAAGGSLFDLQRILGHTTSTMTSRYSHLAPDHFVKYHDLFNKPAALSDCSLGQNRTGCRRNAKTGTAVFEMRGQTAKRRE